MQSDSMTMDDNVDGGAATMHTAGNENDHKNSLINNNAAHLFSLYDDEDDVDMQTVRPAAVLVKSVTPLHSPDIR